jgi:hypothetical protein
MAALVLPEEVEHSDSFVRSREKKGQACLMTTASRAVRSYFRYC